MSAGKKLLFWFRLVVTGIMLLACGYASHAQSNVDDVHIQPRTHASQRDGIVDPSLNAHATLIRKNVNLVLVPITVTDASNRLVTGLDRQNFQIFEGKDAQAIKHFSCEDAPVSVGIALDVSGSMVTKIERARESVMELLRASNPSDEFFLMTFSDSPQLVQDFSNDPDTVRSHLLFARPKGRTSLLDAIYLGIENMRRAKYQRKALVIISDGGDNCSRYSEIDVKSLVKEADVLIYSIGVFDTTFQTREERLGPVLLSEISLATGALHTRSIIPMIFRPSLHESRRSYVTNT